MRLAVLAVFVIACSGDHPRPLPPTQPAAAAIVDGGRSDHKPIWADLERIDP